MAIAEILAVGLPAAIYQKFKEEKTEHVGFSPDKISVIILASAAMTFGALAIGMFFDHLGLLFFPDVLWFRMIGRLSMPLFAFAIAEGCRYTKKQMETFSSLIRFGGGVPVGLLYL